MIPQYFLREQEQFQRLKSEHVPQLRTEIQLKLEQGLSNDSSPSTSLGQNELEQQILSVLRDRIEQDTLILGGALFRADGNLVQAVGDSPQIKDGAIAANRPFSNLLRSQDRYDVLLPSAEFEDQYLVGLRLNAVYVRQSMMLYAVGQGLAGLSLALVVSFVLLLVLQRLLMTPISQLRDDLTAAGVAAGKENSPLFSTFYQTRKDELGDVAIAFCHMYHQIRHEIRDRRRAEAALIGEQEKSDRLLLNILPGAIAKRLKEESGALASRFDEVTILFADIVGFTHLASQMNPLELLTQLNGIFSAFDKLTERYGLEKIKTIGDAYMIVGGVPTPRADHAIAVLEMAIEMLSVMQEFEQPDGKPFQLRIGINTGPVIAGVIGRQKFSYDLWGDSVNIASRMESHGLVGHIQVSPTTYELLRHLYKFEKRSGLVIKGVGTMDTYLYKMRKSKHTASRTDTSLTG